MFETLWDALVPSIGPLATFILLIIAVMGWKLLAKMDKIADKSANQDATIRDMSHEVTELKTSVINLSKDFKDFGKMSERIAIIEDRMNRAHP